MTCVTTRHSLRPSRRPLVMGAHCRSYFGRSKGGPMSKLSRRQALKAVAAAGAVTGCLPSSRAKETRGTMKKTDAVVAVTPQGFPWQTSDPFLFCVHHDDHYPQGN